MNKLRSRRITYYPQVRGSWQVVVHEYSTPTGWVTIHTMSKEKGLWRSDSFPGLKSLTAWKAQAQEWLNEHFSPSKG